MHSHFMRHVLVIVLTLGLCGIAPPVSADPRFKQEIAFDPPATITLGESPLGLSATTNSGLPVEFRSKTTSICTVDGSSLILAKIGTCKVTVTQPGDSTYMAAKAVTRSIEVVTATQVISFAPPAGLSMTDSPYVLDVTATSGLPVSLNAGPSSVCTLSDSSSLVLQGSGACTVTASQGGDWRFEPAAPVTREIAVSLAPQAITFEPPPSVVMTESPVTLSASSSSGLTVSLEAGPDSICTLAGATMTLVAPGLCVVTASQGGDWRFEPAAPVTREIAVSLAPQAISFEPPPSVVMTESPVTLSASSSSGLTVSLFAGPSAVCMVEGSSTLVLQGNGTCDVTASQAGNSLFAAADSVTRSIEVSLATQTVTFHALGSAVMTESPIALTATASSGLPVSFAAGPDDVCTIDGTDLTLVAPGSCEVTASQAGNWRYAPATPVARTFAVLSGDPDVEGPVVSEVVVEPVSVTAGGSVTVTWRAVDAAGVQWSSASVTLPGGQSFLQCGMATRQSGTEADGRWSQTCPILSAAPNGTYSVWISASDLVGNRRAQAFDGTSWEYDTTFTVAGGSNDTEGPVVSEVVVEPLR